MVIVRDCGDFDRLWNDRLDERCSIPRLERDRALADHASGCPPCRGRGLIYAELESCTSLLNAVPAPAPEAFDRWVATASSARLVLEPTAPIRSKPGRPGRRVPLGIAIRVGLAASVAGMVLVGSRTVLPLLFPVEPTPVARSENSALLLEQAFSEATTMTWELAREVSAPAARISSEALGYRSVPEGTYLATTQDEPTEAMGRALDPYPAPNPPGGVELISGSARHAFRFLIGTTTDDSEEIEHVDGL